MSYYPQGYGAQYSSLGDDSRYPTSAAAPQDPFASQTSFHHPGGSASDYPPMQQQHPVYSAPGQNDSTWTVDGGGPFADDGAAKENGLVQRGRDNPYAQDYKPKGAWKKWALIGVIVVVIVGGIAGGIAGWKASSNNNSSSSSGSSTSTGSSSNKLQYSKYMLVGLRRYPNPRGGALTAGPPLSSASRWHGQGSQMEPQRPLRVPDRLEVSSG